MTRRELLELPLAATLVPAQAAGKLRVAVVGGHPDDPESGCGGTMARYAVLGHEVIAVYLTRGEAGIKGKAPAEAAAIRTREAEAACRILGARPVFSTQINGASELNAARYAEFSKLLLGLEPDIVFAHWPIDTHRDHRVASLVAYDAWQTAARKFALHYFEVMTGVQTQNFHPCEFIDITAVEDKKRQACFAHQSQDPAGFWSLHEEMDKFRGLECGAKAAEGFVPYARTATPLH